MKGGILLQPVFALLLPLALFVVLYLACRKENTALDVKSRYRLAMVASLAFLVWAILGPYHGNRLMRLLRDLLATASIACAWGLAVTGWRLGVKKPVTAIVLTILTTMSLVCWSKYWFESFIAHF